MVVPRCLETLYRAGQVRLDDVGRTATVAGVHRRFGRAFEQAGRRRPPPQIVGDSHIAVNELDAGVALSRPSDSSLPRRRRLSNAQTSSSGRSRFNISARLEPTKPAPPVIRMRIRRSDGHGRTDTL